MKTETPPTPTIAELWENLRKADRMEAFKSDLVGCDHDWIVQKVASLRQQLVERCKRPPRTAMVGSTQFFINSHKEHSAYHAFLAWELEQLEKENNHPST